jgi:hypothetical protein
MRIAVAVDERTGVADALAAALTDRGHAVVADNAVNVAHLAAIEATR